MPATDTGGAAVEPAPSGPPPTAIPWISTPKGGGAIRGIGETFAVNPSTGTGSITLPIAVSPGRSGSGPTLTLSYDSGSGNGPFGLGWMLGVPAITRRTDRGLPQYRDAEESDVFVLSGAEDLVPVTDPALRPTTPRTVHGTTYEIAAFRPRIEGLFARIERWVDVDAGIDHWRTIGRDNVTTLYGFDGNSRIADPADERRVFSYLACRTFDDKGNLTVYEYAPEDSSGVDLAAAHEATRPRAARETQRYIKRIRYGNARPYFPDWGPGGSEPALPGKRDWHFELVLDYGEHDLAAPLSEGDRTWAVRPDPFSTYRSTFEVRTYRRCRRVLMFHHFEGESNVGRDCLVASTDLSYADGPVYSRLVAVTRNGYRRSGAGYVKRSLPAVELDYSGPAIDPTVHTLEPESAENLPDGLREGARWADLDGDGAGGALTTAAAEWTLKRNLSPLNVIVLPDGSRVTRARLGPLESVPEIPAPGDLGGDLQLLDLGGDGRLDAVAFSGPAPGFYERTDEGGWQPLRPFRSLPQIDFRDPNVRLVDVGGAGRADVLVTEAGTITVYPSLGEQGFGPARRVATGWAEDDGPHVLLADGTQTVFTADLSGDGLGDLVRVRNGETCYWPSLGDGRFGAKVTMDGSPWFADEGTFDPARVRFADVDGSGTADLLYVDDDGVRLWFNESGNAWGAPHRLGPFPTPDPGAVQVVDLLGCGTACLVWSSCTPDPAAPVRYVDLMGSAKPHLLTRVRNNLGAETRMRYAPSTRHYLADRAANRPWPSRLPFPVHVVDRVEVLDWIGRTRLVNRYAYHYGHFDPDEREFRGFGLVEQWDTEEHRDDTDFPDIEAANWDTATWSPPVRTRTWFHTGAYLDAVSRQHTGDRWIEPALRPAGKAADRAAMELPDTELEADLTPEERREALRALKGRVLRTEVATEDGTARAGDPYTVSEHNYTVRRVQRQGTNRHAVFDVNPRETLRFEYERRADDPRVTHEVALEVGPYGEVRRQVSVCYPRRATIPAPEPGLPALFRGMLAYDQARLRILATENRHTGALDDPYVRPDVHRVPAVSETIAAELTGVAPNSARAGITNLFRFAELEQAWADAAGNDIAYEELPRADVDGSGTPATVAARRILDRTRTLYRRDDLTGLLALHELEPLALPGVTYRLALTATQLARVFGSRVTAATLQEGGYVQLGADWWSASEHVRYSPGAADTPATELQRARGHFFLVRRAIDSFGAAATVDYDGHDLLTERTTDAAGNTTTATTDYRTLKPALVTDPNGNRTEVAFDALGAVAGTAVMGKTTEALGDTLAGFEPDPDESAALAHLADPLADPAAVLAGASARMLHDRFAYLRTRDDPQPAPPVVYAIIRETHASDGAATRHRHTFGYSDGFGREIQRKAQAERGPVTAGGGDVSPRWIGSGWTVFGNKGKAVRSYEPFFSGTHRFEFARQVGVASTAFYDPLGRLVATLHPDDTWEKVVFEGWRQETWDRGDTVGIADPRDDEHVGPYFARLLGDGAFTSWWSKRKDGTFGATAQQRAAEQDAATKSLDYAGTPSVAHLDACGRPTTIVVHAGAQRHPTRTALDAEGKPLAVIDPRGRRVVEHCLREPVGAAAFRYIAGYDVAGAPLYRNGSDDGQRRSLANVAGRPLRTWDARGHAARFVYDALQRMTHRYLSTGGTTPLLVERAVYGEGQPGRNLCGRRFRLYDGAGVAESARYDFKGNLTESSRRLARDDHTTLDWSALATLSDPADLDAAAAPLLEAEQFTTLTTFDALDRPIQTVTPHAVGMRPSVLRHGYGDGGLLERVDVWLRRLTAPAGLLDPATADVQAIRGIDYDARGRRTRVELGSGVVTAHRYDRLTFRLAGLTSTRPDMFPADRRVVQDLSYTYDAAGNPTRVHDGADTQNVVFFRNRRVDPTADYAYDPLYRLMAATGREHLGQSGGGLAAPGQTGDDDGPRMRLPHPHDGNAVGRYTETYGYDGAGNLTLMSHQVAGAGGWSRRYAYEEPSRIDAGEPGNRLTATSLPGDPPAGPYSAMYAHDAHGNMTAMPHLPALVWDEGDRLRSATRQVVTSGTPETTYFAYDAQGQRLRKGTDGQAAAGQQPRRRSTRLYLGPLEVYREYEADGMTVALERETLHVGSGEERVALVETRTAGSDPAPGQLIRYQHTNQLGSALLELDAGADIVSYEEYFPYGATAFQAVRSQIETPKRYRYTGKERDEETALYYHGARYYAPWLGRWTSCDPAGLADGPNLYAYARGSPVRLVDPNGTQATRTDDRATTAAAAKRAWLAGGSSRVSYLLEEQLNQRVPFSIGPLKLDLLQPDWAPIHTLDFSPSVLSVLRGEAPVTSLLETGGAVAGDFLGSTEFELPKDPKTDPDWKQPTKGFAYGQGKASLAVEPVPGTAEWRALAGVTGTFGVGLLGGQVELSGRASAKGLLSGAPPFKLSDPNTDIAVAAELSAELRVGPKRDLVDVHANATLRGSDLSGSASFRLLGHEVFNVTGSGRVDLDTGRVRLGGEFSGPLTRGSWGYGSTEGFSARGLLLGPARLAPSDLNFGASIAQNVLRPGLGGFGLGAGVFTYSRNLTGYLGLGVGPASYSDMFPGGVQRSVPGKSGGFYVGAYLSLSALAF